MTNDLPNCRLLPIYKTINRLAKNRPLLPQEPSLSILLAHLWNREGEKSQTADPRLKWKAIWIDRQYTYRAHVMEINNANIADAASSVEHVRHTPSARLRFRIQAISCKNVAVVELFPLGCRLWGSFVVSARYLIRAPLFCFVQVKKCGKSGIVYNGANIVLLRLGLGFIISSIIKPNCKSIVGVI